MQCGAKCVEDARDPSDDGCVRDRIQECAVDFHVDFNFDPEDSDLPTILAETERLGFSGRVLCGHVTKLPAFASIDLDDVGGRLADAGIGVVTMPATELFLLGRSAGSMAPRGLAPLTQLDRFGARTAIATNNVLNPFTPYGDASLLRKANLYANVVQLGRNDRRADPNIDQNCPNEVLR